MVTLYQRVLFYANVITAFTGRPENYSWLAWGACLRARVAKSNHHAGTGNTVLFASRYFPPKEHLTISLRAPHWRTDQVNQATL